jgi:membrane protease YdiL (CAAX protease family)
MELSNSQELKQIDKQKQLTLFLIGWLGLWIFAIFFTVFAQLILPNFLSEENFEIYIASDEFFNHVNFLTYLSLFTIGCFILYPFMKATLLPAIQSKAWILGLAFTFVILFSNYSLLSIYSFFEIILDDNQNQAAIVLLVKDAPLLSLVTFGILGPIVEEWTYRLGLFQFLRNRNRIIAYIVTLTVFGFIHFDFTSSNLMNELLNLPMYLIAGAWFCFIYDRFGLKTAMATHITNNLLSVLVILATPGSSSIFPS